MVVVKVDYILVSGRSDAEHVRNLDAVLKKVSEAGLMLKKQKCRFMQPSVEYLGYVIDKERIHPMSRKLKLSVKCLFFQMLPNYGNFWA